MRVDNALMMMVCLAAFGTGGAHAQNPAKAIQIKAMQIPAALSARFADMVGKWTISGEATVRGQRGSVKGRVACYLVADRTALMCPLKLSFSALRWNFKAVRIFAYDPVRKSVWAVGANNVSGADFRAGTYSNDGFVLGSTSVTSDGKARKETEKLSGKIGAGKLMQTIRTTVGDKVIEAVEYTWIKQK